MGRPLLTNGLSRPRDLRSVPSCVATDIFSTSTSNQRYKRSCIFSYIEGKISRLPLEMTTDTQSAAGKKSSLFSLEQHRSCAPTLLPVQLLDHAAFFNLSKKTGINEICR